MVENPILSLAHPWAAQQLISLVVNSISGKDSNASAVSIMYFLYAVDQVGCGRGLGVLKGMLELETMH